MNECVNDQSNQPNEWLYVSMNELVDNLIIEWIIKWVNERKVRWPTDECMTKWNN